MFLHVIDAKYDEDYRIKIKFNNGAEGIVDLEKELYGEIFTLLKDIKLFQKFTRRDALLNGLMAQTLRLSIYLRLRS